MTDDYVTLNMRNHIGPPLQVAKWLKCPVLLGISEMESLLSDLGEFWILLISGVVPVNGGFVSKEKFLEGYAEYIETLRRGEIPDDLKTRSLFSSVWTVDLNTVYGAMVQDGRQIIKVEKPVIQLQSHRFNYYPSDGKFHSMIFGIDTICWGIQFSYPQLYQDTSLLVQHVKETAEFPNTSFFKALQRWMRNHTTATPFLVENRRVNASIRLGKSCFEWINNHPQLIAKGLKVIHSK